MQASDVDIYPVVNKLCSGVYAHLHTNDVMYFVHNVAVQEVLMMTGNTVKIKFNRLQCLKE